MAKGKDYTKRANVLKWQKCWEGLLKEKGGEWCTNILHKGHTVKLSRKDRLGLLQVLGLSTKGT